MCIVQCALRLLSFIAQAGQFVIFEYGFESYRPPPFPRSWKSKLPLYERSTESVDRRQNLGWSMRFFFGFLKSYNHRVRILLYGYNQCLKRAKKLSWNNVKIKCTHCCLCFIHKLSVFRCSFLL